MGEPLSAVLRFGAGELGPAYLERRCFVPTTGQAGAPLPGGLTLRPGLDAASLALSTERPLDELAYVVQLASDRCADLPRATLDLTLLPGAAEGSVGEVRMTLAAPASTPAPAAATGPAAPAAPAASALPPASASVAQPATKVAKEAAARNARPAPRGRERGLTLARSLSNPPDDANPERSQFLRDVFAALQADPEDIAATLRQVDRLNALATETIAALSAAQAPTAPAPAAAATSPARSLSTLPDPMLGGVTVLLLAGSMAWLARRRREEPPEAEDAPLVTVPVPVPRKPPARPVPTAGASHAGTGGNRDHHDPREDLNFSVRLV